MIGSVRPDLRRLWIVTVVAIAAIVAVGILVSRTLPGHEPSPVAMRLALAAVVTILAAVAKVVAGPRAAAVTAVLGVLVGVILLITIW
jgi:hypothetical protein